MENHSLPRSTEEVLELLRGQRVALVGNATPEHAFGEVIDRYDVVIRFNNFITSGFERLVGTKTDYRCTFAGKSIEHRNEQVEFTPFTPTYAPGLEEFNRANERPLLTARTDIHILCPEIPNPSTGFALVLLCANLDLPVDLFAFDGFATAHYWENRRSFVTWHSPSELSVMLKLPKVRLFVAPQQIARDADSPIGSDFFLGREGGAIQFYEQVVSMFSTMLGNLEKILLRVESGTQTGSADPQAFMDMRLAPDMQPLVHHLQLVTDTATTCANRLAGEPSMRVDGDRTFAGLRERVRNAIAQLSAFKPERFEDAAQRVVTLQCGDVRHRFTAAAYVLDLVVPRFYFHYTMAYAILRHKRACNFADFWASEELDEVKLREFRQFMSATAGERC